MFSSHGGLAGSGHGYTSSHHPISLYLQPQPQARPIHHFHHRPHPPPPSHTSSSSPSPTSGISHHFFNTIFGFVSWSNVFDGWVVQVENAFNGAVDFGAGAVAFLRRVFDAVRPGDDAAVPVVKQAESKALDLASPIVVGASKQAQDILQSAGIDPAPALNAAKTVAVVVQQAPKVVEGAKPIASAT